MFQPEKFNIDYKNNSATVEVLSIAGQTIYRVVFANRNALILTRATNSNAARFWTSIPEGKMEMAEEVGVLIEQYLKQKI